MDSSSGEKSETHCGGEATGNTESQSAMSNISQSKSGSSDRDLRIEKERFLLLTRVLVNYLKQEDSDLHEEVKAVIKDCGERNWRKEPGYESATTSMRENLKQVVSEIHWKRAEECMQDFLAQPKKRCKTVPSSSAASSSCNSDVIHKEKK